MVIAVEKQCLIYFVSLNFYPMKTTMKVMATLVACALLSSCITVSRPVAATGNPVGAKCGEAKSYIICGLFSLDGDTNGIDKAAKKAGKTGENLLILLETRMDNVVFRLGFASSRKEARQLVTHGHFTVNGKKADIPSMELKAGDVIKVKEKSQSSPKFKEVKEMAITVPSWMSVDVEKLEGKIVTLPTRADIDTPVAEHLIVELYSK